MTLSGARVRDQPSLLEELIAEGKHLAVVTNGRDGSLAMDASDTLVHTPAVLDYPMVDTNGAGDSFHAGLLYGVATGRTRTDALRLATVVAGMTVSSPDLFHHDLGPALLERDLRRHFGGR